MSSECAHCGGALTARQIKSGCSCCSKRCAVLHRNYPPRECCVDGCSRHHRRNGYCDMHARRMAKNGTLQVTRWAEMSTEERFWSKVKRGLSWVGVGSLPSSGGR